MNDDTETGRTIREVAREKTDLSEEDRVTREARSTLMGAAEDGDPAKNPGGL